MLNFRKFSFILILFILSAVHVSAQTVVNGGYTFKGPLTANDLDAGNVANKNNAADGVQYVSTSGNDSNDGLSWGTAKLTWVGACQALPGGATSPPTCGKGTINYVTGISANPVANAGIWLFTSADPGYAGGVSGWNRYSGVIKTVCSGAGTVVTNLGTALCIINGGSSADNNHPLLWLSSMNGGLEFDGLAANYQGIQVEIGICSNGTDNGTCAVQNVRFNGVNTQSGNATAGLGPAWLIGDGCFWIIVNDYNISGNANNSPTADNGAAVLLTRNTKQSGLIEFTDGGFNTGGIKYYAGNGAYLIVNGLTTSENNLEALLWVLGGTDQSTSTISIQNAGVSDCNTMVAHCAVVRNDDTGPVHISNISGLTIGQVVTDTITLKNFKPDSTTNVSGWMSYGTAISSSGSGLLPILRAQSGNIPRSFPPSIAFGTNLVSISTNVPCGTCTVTTGVLDPTGQTNAVRISDSASSQDATQFTLSSSGGAVNGDTYIASMWVRSTDGTGYSRNAAFGLYLNGSDVCNSSGSDLAAAGQLATTEKAWTHYITVCKITTGPSGTPSFQVFNQLGFTTEYAFPQVVLFHGYNDEDLANIAMNIGSWANNCPIGDTCPITMFGFPGSTAFEGLVTHANTANRTYTFPNVTGNIPAYTVSPTNLDCPNWSGTGGLLGDPGGACARYTITPTNGDCVTWSGTGGLLGDAGAACGASGGGLNTNMNNMANPTAMSQSLIPGAVNSIALGSQALPFTNGFFGTVANQSGSFNTANLTANRVINWPDATSTTVRACASVSNQFLTAIAVATGVCSQAQPTLANIAAGASPSGLFDFSGSTMKVPQANGFTASAISTIGLDTAAGAFHFWIGAADSINAAFASAPAGSKCIQSSGVIGLLTEASAACGTTTPSSVDTFTHKTEDVEGTGNSFSEPVRAFFPAGGCNNSTAGNGWDIGVTNVPLPQCAGTTVRKGVLQFARGNTGYINWHLPSDWNSSVSTDIEICFTTTDTTNGHVTSFNIQTGFNAVNGTVTDDPTLNTLQALSVTTGASQTSGGQLCGKLTSMTMTGSAADYNFEIAVTRNNSGTDTNTDTGVLVKSAEIITGVTKNAANR